MAATVIDRAWRDTTPDAVDGELAALWRDVASRGAVARAVMSNLVVFRFRERRESHRTASASTDAIEAVLARHPSRAIVIEHDRGDHDPRAPVGARVGVCIFGSPATRYGAEEVIIRSACADVSLPSIVRRFARGDLPTSIWWTEDLSQWPPLPALLAEGRQLIYDSREWRDPRAGFGAIAPLVAARRLDVADLNWGRLAPLRRALTHATRGFADRHASVRVAHRPGDSALAWLSAGWLTTRLGWKSGEWPTIHEARHASELVEIAIGDGDRVIEAAMNGHRVRVTQAGATPMTLPAPRDVDAEAMAAELRALSRDAELHESLAAIAAQIVQS